MAQIKLDKYFIATAFVGAIYAFGFGTLFFVFSFGGPLALAYPFCGITIVAAFIYLIFKLARIKWKKRWLATNILAAFFLLVGLFFHRGSMSGWDDYISSMLSSTAVQASLCCVVILINTLPYEIFQYFKRKSSAGA